MHIKGPVKPRLKALLAGNSHTSSARRGEPVHVRGGVLLPQQHRRNALQREAGPLDVGAVPQLRTDRDARLHVLEAEIEDLEMRLGLEDAARLVQLGRPVVPLAPARVERLALRRKARTRVFRGADTSFSRDGHEFFEARTRVFRSMRAHGPPAVTQRSEAIAGRDLLGRELAVLPVTGVTITQVIGALRFYRAESERRCGRGLQWGGTYRAASERSSGRDRS